MLAALRQNLCHSNFFPRAQQGDSSRKCAERMIAARDKTEAGKLQGAGGTFLDSQSRIVWWCLQQPGQAGADAIGRAPARRLKTIPNYAEAFLATRQRLSGRQGNLRKTPWGHIAQGRAGDEARLLS